MANLSKILSHHIEESACHVAIAICIINSAVSLFGGMFRVVSGKQKGSRTCQTSSRLVYFAAENHSILVSSHLAWRTVGVLHHAPQNSFGKGRQLEVEVSFSAKAEELAMPAKWRKVHTSLA